MKLHVNKESSIRSIQKEFNEHYPFLKIEFFKNNSQNQPFVKSSALSALESSRKLDGVYAGRTIGIDGSRTVAELEEDFKNVFGYSVLLFRKSGNVWVETTLTDDWTLDQQNQEGEQISSHFF